MHNLKRQQGLTFITILIILGLIGFFTWITLKIAPIYINHGRVKNAMAGVENEPLLLTWSSDDIIKSFEKRFDINYVEHVDKKNIAVTKHGSYVKVEIDYEVIVPLCCHLSALGEFHEAFEKGKE